MRKIVLVDSTYPINTRTKKIADSLAKEFGYENIFVVAWNRDGREIKYSTENEYILSENATYGSKFAKLSKLLSFKKFVNKVLLENKFDYVIASHWDVLWIINKRYRSYKKLVYENLDIPTSENKIVLKILQKIEKKTLRKTDAIIFASRFFVPLYDFFYGTKILLENKPLVKRTLDLQFKKNTSSNMVITFLGVIRYRDIMENLVTATKNVGTVELRIYGDGPDYEAIKEFCKNAKNVTLYGRYESKDLDGIYNNSDVVWAVYPNKDYNVKYAISNKFHESFMYAKPCIYATDTKLGDYVNENKIGFTVNPYSVDEIKSLIENLNSKRELLNTASENLKKMYLTESSWEEEFKKVINFIQEDR